METKKTTLYFVLALRAPFDPIWASPHRFSPHFFGGLGGCWAVRLLGCWWFVGLLLLLGFWAVLLGCCTGCLGCWAVAGGGLLFEDTAKRIARFQSRWWTLLRRQLEVSPMTADTCADVHGCAAWSEREGSVG